MSPQYKMEDNPTPDPNAIDSVKAKEDKELEDAMSFLGIDDTELKKNTTLSFKTEKDISNKVTQIKNLALNYRMTLSGRTYVEEAGGYKQTGPSLAGHHFLSLSSGLLSAYSDESNLITTKDFEKFAIQFIDCFEKIESLLLRDRSIGEKDARTIFKLFKDTLMNIGDIITGTQGNMEKVFAKYRPEEYEGDRNLF